MLVLSRKRQQSVVVGQKDGVHRLLKFTVLEIGVGKVKLGFEVDADVPVHRLEVWERINGNVQLFANSSDMLGAPDIRSAG